MRQERKADTISQVSFLLLCLLFMAEAGCAAETVPEKQTRSRRIAERVLSSSIGSLLSDAAKTVDVGRPSDYPIGHVEEEFQSEFGFFVVHEQYEDVPQFFALRAICTHLGGTPIWRKADQKFQCPFHGSGFHKNGINFEGPAPRPLERYAIRLNSAGHLEVDTRYTFHQEYGQWSNPASFVVAQEDGDKVIPRD